MKTIEQGVREEVKCKLTLGKKARKDDDHQLE
jgi:hypothetical protein